MARGRLGGTKAKIRGKVGGDIYQLKRDPDGTLFQSVYEQNPNPKYSNTESQARNRCIMGQIERMWHWLPTIIKDAFFNVARGTLSFQQFSRLNYAMLKDDFDNHFDGDSDFSWNKKYDLHAPAGPWILTIGTLPEITWSEAVCSLGWNNGIEIIWSHRSLVATYGDFLSCFGMQHGDRLVVAFFRQDANDVWGYVETWSFWARDDYQADTPWNEVDDEHPFVTNCPYLVLSGLMPSDNTFFFDIDTQDYEKQIKIACFTFFLIRPSEHGTLFSSSKFSWAQRNVAGGFLRHSPQDVWGTWFNND